MAGPAIGDVVLYTDHFGSEHKALVTANWGGQDDSAINLVYVDGDETKTDSWGRQIARDSSVPHQSHQSAPGNFWLPA